MFISNDEKKYLFDQIKALSREQSSAVTEITMLKAKLKAAEGNILVLKQIVEHNRVKPKKPKTLAQKAKQREYMRKYVARKKAEKLALEQK
jgi:regulator of replication initiation timing